jgi:hypothetical protein
MSRERLAGNPTSRLPIPGLPEIGSNMRMSGDPDLRMR